ncbi:hypothetical protein DVVG_00029 [Dunaliella viridis virus SI2]|uniref:hypothetical protein n=1 Tax=Dunaliella viridis virus SI2 TaxID=754069 RepID=UPI0002C05F59|nr:hypothetical protein DVVG_00029 [Dunaliella viridis virus SI2]AGH16015.1 hypothetical protein DVVG_00029 [Dunaliella viridis virus SI2]
MRDQLQVIRVAAQAVGAFVGDGAAVQAHAAISTSAPRPACRPLPVPAPGVADVYSGEDARYYFLSPTKGIAHPTRFG